MNGEIDSFYFKKFTLSTSVKPCFLQSDLRFPSTLESSSYMKLNSLLEWSQQLCNAKWRGNENGKKTNKQTIAGLIGKKQLCTGSTLFGKSLVHFFAVVDRWYLFAVFYWKIWHATRSVLAKWVPISRNIGVTNVLSYKVNATLYTCIHVLCQLLSWTLLLAFFLLS